MKLPHAAAFPMLVLILAFAACSPSLPQIERVVLITLDTTRADRIGCYGYGEAHTPQLDALAEQGVLFEHAVSTVPTTLPAHSTIFTGLYPQDHGVRYNLMYKLGDEMVTLPELLQEHGFMTAGFPATHILHERFGLNQGFDNWNQPEFDDSPSGKNPVANMRPAGEGVDLALTWLDEQGEDKSFVWLHFYDPHWPYTPPFPYSDTYRDRPYDGELAYTDAQLGRLLKALRADPQWDRTLVVVTGDHGEGLYDHGERYHSILTYETTQHIPMIIRAPGAVSTRVAEPVTLADLSPTILDLVGAAPLDHTRGISLREALVGGELPRREIYFESLAGAITYGWAELNGVMFGRWKLIDSIDPELFDLETDPNEQENLVDREPERLAQFRMALEDMSTPIVDAGDATMTMDAEQTAKLQSLGYTAGELNAASGADVPHPRELIDLEPELLNAQTLMANSRWQEFEEVNRYVLSRDPKNKFCLRGLVTALTKQHRAAEAEAYALRLVDVIPDSDQAYILLAQVHVALEQPDRAYSVLTTGLLKAPESEQLKYLVLVAAIESNVPDVCTHKVPEAMAAMPEDNRFIVLEARCQARAGDPDAALATLVQAVDQGFQRLKLLESAEDFSDVSQLAGFRDLLERIEAEQAGDDDEGPKEPDQNG